MAEVVRRYDDHKYKTPDHVTNLSDDPSKNPNLRLPWMLQHMDEIQKQKWAEWYLTKMGLEGQTIDVSGTEHGPLITNL